jgi:ubiquitin-protein ligase
LLEVFKTQNNTTTTFEHLLELLRFIGQKTYVGRVQCTLFKQPFLKHGFELFFNGFQTVTIPMLDIDFRELDFIQLQLEINNQAIIAATSKVLMFIPVTVMSARRQNRICFLSLKNHMGLFLSSTAAKQQTRDKLCIIDPAKGKQEDWDPETLAKEIGVQDLEKFAAVEEVSELVIVCVDTSGSMKSPFANTSRFEAAQIFFRKFADQAYKFRVDNVYGLSQFGRQFGTIRELSPISADFKDGLNNLAVAGNTPMWDVICEAANKLAIKQREAYAGRPLRIIVLTDGGSNGRKTITDALPLLLRYNIHLDGIIFGSDAPDRWTELDWFGPLIAAVRMTGGYMFIPKTMDDTDRLFQDEAFFNATIREYGPMLPQEELAQLRTRIAQDSAEAKADTKMRSKNHEKTIGTSSRNFADAWWIIANKGRPESYRDARLLEELRYVAGNANPDIHVLVNRDDISEWRVLFRVDENSRYSNLWFQLLLKFPDLYPANGPFIRFVGPPYHVNVSEQGRINLPEVQEYYDESFHVFEIVEEIKLLLQKVRRRARLYRGDDDVVEPADCGDGIDPLTDDNPIDNAHAQAYHDPARYKALVAEWNARNGKRETGSK